jgi:sRNA-binding carbon storage regulator CsrA
MFILTRKPGQTIQIVPGENLDPATPVGDLFMEGAIEVTVSRIEAEQVELVVGVPSRLLILRGELAGKSAS